MDRNRQDSKGKALLAIKLRKQYSITNKPRNANKEKPFLSDYSNDKECFHDDTQHCKGCEETGEHSQKSLGSVNYYRFSLGVIFIKNLKLFLFFDLIILSLRLYPKETIRDIDKDKYSRA